MSSWALGRTLNGETPLAWSYPPQITPNPRQSHGKGSCSCLDQGRAPAPGTRGRSRAVGWRQTSPLSPCPTGAFPPAAPGPCPPRPRVLRRRVFAGAAGYFPRRHLRAATTRSAAARGRPAPTGRTGTAGAEAETP